jgi:DNA-binding CsgD family transcriptional regulator
VQGLLERHDVLAELAAVARRAGGGSGRLVLLRGEAGVGKTAVIDRFSAGLDGSWRVLRGWCEPLGAPRPLGPLIDALPGLGSAAAGPVAALHAGDISAMYARLLAVLGSGPRWVWVIEDVHWADGATLDLLRFLARRVDSLPLLLLVSYRDDELGDQHPLSAALGDVAGCAGVHRIGLTPLSRVAVGTLAAGSGVNADELYQLTGGNPFFATEVLAGGADAVADNVLPRSVAEAVWGRLTRLSTAGRETAQAAAICGPRAEAELVQGVCPGAVAGLAECLSVGVLTADGDVIGFRHELARRATLDRIDDQQRRVLHKQALTILAEEPVDPNTLALLAFHAHQAGDHDAVIRYGPVAAERAAGLGAHRQAADLYALALQNANAVPDEHKVRWLEQHAFAAFLSGVDATASWREAIALRHAMGEPFAESEDLRWLSHSLIAVGRLNEAVDAGLASRQLVQDAGVSPQLALSLVRLAELAVWKFDPAATDYAARAIVVGTQLGDDAVVLRARGFAAVAQVLRTDTGWEELEAAWRDAMATDARGEHAGVLGMWVCWVATLHYDLDRADRYIADTVAYCRDRNLFTFEAFVTGIAALNELHRGRWARATACAEDVLTRPGLPALPRIAPQLTLALIHARRGERPATSLLDDIEAGFDSELRLFPVWAARTEIGWLTGDDDAARSEGQRALATVGAEWDPWLTGQLRRWLYLAGGQPDTSADELCTPFQSEVDGDWRSAAEAWMRRGCPYEAALAQLRGDIGAVESALATFRGLGARAAAARARQRLNVLRGRTPSGSRADTRSDPDGLTRREREVLELLAGRRSNAEIAAALHISPKTVGCHVSSILAKLGVDNRLQAGDHALNRQTATSS